MITVAVEGGQAIADLLVSLLLGLRGFGGLQKGGVGGQ